jgi:hypothetical protein
MSNRPGEVIVDQEGRVIIPMSPMPVHNPQRRDLDAAHTGEYNLPQDDLAWYSVGGHFTKSWREKRRKSCHFIAWIFAFLVVVGVLALLVWVIYKNVNSNEGTGQTTVPGAALYTACGGIGWNGTITCAEGTCVAISELYSQCEPLA